MLKGAYTFSRAMNETDADGRTGLAFGGHPGYRDRSWARALFDRPHNFQLGFVYQLPWQHQGSGYGSVTKAILGDWQLNGVYAAFSGTPFHVTSSGTALNTPGITQTANFSGGDLRVHKQDRRGRRVVRHDDVLGADGRHHWHVTRNQFRGPGGWTLDLSLFRTIPVGGLRRRLDSGWRQPTS